MSFTNFLDNQCMSQMVHLLDLVWVELHFGMDAVPLILTFGLLILDLMVAHLVP